MDARNNIAQDLFYKIRSRFSGLKLGGETGEITINPADARFFDFDYMEGETPLGHVSISLAEPNSMKVYFSTGITESMNPAQKDNWYGFLRELRSFAKKRLMAFDTRDIAKDNLDQRDYEFLIQNSQPKPETSDTIQKPVGESIMSESTMYGSRTMSYQKLMDTRLIIKHSKAVMDDMNPGARTRNISALFVENQDGERFKYPFIHLAGARAMQRHVANGGVPYDDIGQSIIKMSEEIAQLKSFSNYVVRNDLMNSDTNNIVERSSEALNNLREQIKALSRQSHYEAYKESFQAQAQLEVPEEVVEDFVEKFTVKNFKEDIKSVFPVLYRLMQEDNTIGYDDIVAMTKQEQVAEDEGIEIESQDPFDQFENWVMALGEESAISSEDPEEQKAAIKELQELVGEHFPAGVDGSNAIESLKGIIEDPQLFKQIKDQAKEDPDGCVRPLVKAWLENNAPEVVDQLDFGDMVEEPAKESMEEGKMKDLHQDVEDYLVRMSDIFTDQEEYNLSHEFHELAYDLEKVGIGGVMKQIQKRADETGSKLWKGIYKEFSKKFGKFAEDVDAGVEEGQSDVDYELHQIAKSDDEEELIDAMGGLKGAELQIALEDMMEELKDELASKGMNDVMNDEDKMIEMLMDKIIDEYGEDGEEYDYGDMDSSDADADALKSAGFGSDEDYESIETDKKDDKDDLPFEPDENPTDKDEFGNTIKHRAKHLAKKGMRQAMDVKEVAEFINSFYDRNTGTFPKGPEGVCTMVGKKFGEQAEAVARKFVERMAPHQEQGAEELAELGRMRELAGVQSAAQEQISNEEKIDWKSDDVETVKAMGQEFYVKDTPEGKLLLGDDVEGYFYTDHNGAEKEGNITFVYNLDTGKFLEFPKDYSDFYGYLKDDEVEDFVKELVDEIKGKMGSNEESITPELEDIRRLSGISRGLGY